MNSKNLLKIFKVSSLTLGSFAVISILPISIGNLKANALTPGQFVNEIKSIADRSTKGQLTNKEEIVLFEAARTEYLEEQKPKKVGQVLKNGSPLATFIPGKDLTEALTFYFIDSETDLPTTSPISIGSVFYEVNLDPTTDIWNLIGSSTDSSSNFEVIFNLPLDFVEPIIRGIPYDINGVPIVIPANDGPGNVAIGYAFNVATTPEPASILSLLALGTIGAASTLKRKLKPSQSTEKETTKVG